MIFDADPGELFVIRNVANLVPPYAPDGAYHGTSAAVEFAVRVLEVRDVIVLGHAMCGGVRALLTGEVGAATDFVAPWMAIAAPARARAVRDGAEAEAAQDAGEHEVVKVSLENLRTYPWLAERVAAGRLALHGARFDIRDGRLEMLGADGAFRAVA
jgi:carbonic anhydrase